MCHKFNIDASLLRTVKVNVVCHCLDISTTSDWMLRLLFHTDILHFLSSFLCVLYVRIADVSNSLSAHSQCYTEMCKGISYVPEVFR